jgi:signal recognition particle receptor subunit beta
MVVFNYSGEEINAKIVYYGPGLSGKTTNLEFIYSKMPTQVKGKMVSMKTRTDRTLFFDFLPLELGDINGYRTRFLLYTVPGQVYYNATRKLVLKGVDAVVFVADSTRGKMDENIESLQNLEENLNELNLTLDSIPWAIQYNKRDQPDALPIADLEQQLNLLSVPFFEAVATSGEGIYETFQGIARLLYSELQTRLAETGMKKPAEASSGAAVPAPGEPAAVEDPLSQMTKQPSTPSPRPPQMPAAPVMKPVEAMSKPPAQEPDRAPEARIQSKNDTVEIPGRNTAETKAMTDVIDLALREVGGPAGLREDRPVPAAPVVTEPPPAQTGPTAKPAADTGLEAVAPAASNDPVAIDVQPIPEIGPSEPEPLVPQPAEDSDFSPMSEAELHTGLGRVVELDELSEPVEQEKSNGDGFITDPCRSVVPNDAEDQEPLQNDEDSPGLEPKSARKHPAEELTVNVPVLISRSQIRRTIPLKLILEIHVTDDESRS